MLQGPSCRQGCKLDCRYKFGSTQCSCSSYSAKGNHLLRLQARTTGKVMRSQNLILAMMLVREGHHSTAWSLMIRQSPCIWPANLQSRKGANGGLWADCVRTVGGMGIDSNVCCLFLLSPPTLCRNVGRFREQAWSPGDLILITDKPTQQATTILVQRPDFIIV